MDKKYFTKPVLVASALTLLGVVCILGMLYLSYKPFMRLDAIDKAEILISDDNPFLEDN